MSWTAAAPAVHGRLRYSSIPHFAHVFERSHRKSLAKRAVRAAVNRYRVIKKPLFSKGKL